MDFPLARRSMLASGAALGLAGCAAWPDPTDLMQSPAARLPRTHQADLRDAASGLVWRVWVQVPDAPAPAAGYPVLVVLDGNAMFPLAAQLARNEMARPADRSRDPVVVVGIGHPGEMPYQGPERARDYTPPPPAGRTSQQTGGAGVLLDFITGDLRARIARGFPIDKQRQTLAGHSFSGLFVLQALFTRPEAFTRYAAMSPSIWWNDAQVLGAEQEFVRRHAAARGFSAALQLRVGELEQASAVTDPARIEALTRRPMVRHAREMAARLAALGWPELRVEVQVVPGADHGTVITPSLVDALALAQRRV